MVSGKATICLLKHKNVLKEKIENKSKRARSETKGETIKKSQKKVWWQRKYLTQ